MNVYVTHDGETLGPFTEEQAKEKFRSGAFTPADLVCLEGEESWKPLDQMFPDESSPAAAAPGQTAAARSPVATFLLVFGGIIVLAAALFAVRTLFFPKPAPVDSASVEEAAPAADDATPAPEAPTPAPEMVDSPTTPGEKDLAIAPEIARGAKAIGDLAAAPNITAYEKEISDTFSVNKDKGTDSPGFLMGANYGAWKALSGLLSGPDVIKANDATAVKIATGAAVIYFQEFRASQTEQHVSDEEFVKAIGYRSPEEQAKGIEMLEHDEALFSQFTSQ